MIKNIIQTLFIVLLCNVFFQIIAYYTGTERSLINLDYFLLIFLLYKDYKNFFYAIGFIIAFFDFMNLFVQIFPFVRIEDLLSILKFAFISSPVYQIFGVIILICIQINMLLIRKIYNQRLNIYLIIVFNTFLLTAFIQKNFLDTTNPRKFWKPHTGDLVVSGTINYALSTKSLFTDSFKDSGNALKEVNLDHATSGLLSDSSKYNKILLVINESWGKPINPKIQDAVIKPLTDLNNYKINNLEIGEIKFSGFTVAGELRELCRVVPLHYNFKDQYSGFENCLPHQMRKSGFKTISVHGALGSMYDRHYWYPRAGFDETLFRDVGLKLIKSRCYSFPGNCDKDIATVVTKKIKTNDKIFLYWLTLNTHAIYDRRDLYYDNFECEAFHIDKNSQSCRNLKLQHQFFYTLSQLIKLTNEQGIKVVVVGDHAPPIISNEKRIFFEDTVPKIEFFTK